MTENFNKFVLNVIHGFNFFSYRNYSSRKKPFLCKPDYQIAINILIYKLFITNKIYSLCRTQVIINKGKNGVILIIFLYLLSNITIYYTDELTIK